MRPLMKVCASMTNRNRSVAGAFDYFGEIAVDAEVVVDRICAQFRRFDYEPIAPPIIERTEPFLDRSGEDIRRRMYMFTDPGGRELCLRPELTIPTARLFIDRFGSSVRHFRGYYAGPVFRYDSPREGRYRQFTQLGAESIGDSDREAADAEILALAHACFDAAELNDDITTIVGDVEMISSVLRDDSVPVFWSRRLLSIAADPPALMKAISGAVDGERSSSAELGLALGDLQAAERVEAVRSLLEAAGADHLGVRSADEIADRLLRRSRGAGSEALPRKVSEALEALLVLDGPLVEVIEAATAIGKEYGLEELVATSSAWHRRVALFAAHGLEPDEIVMRPSLRRGIDYYTSFIFELHDGSKSPVSQICAGGRYDDLVSRLGGKEARGVGFAIGLERVLLRRSTMGRGQSAPTADAVIVSGGDVELSQCVALATTLRKAGYRIRVAEGHRVRYALERALKADVPVLVIVGEEEIAYGNVVIRDLRTRTEHKVSRDAVALELGALLAEVNYD